MTIEEAIKMLKSKMDGQTDTSYEWAETVRMAIRSLEMQKELAEYSGMDICQFVEDYDYEENDISEYEYEDSVDNFLIDEVKAEMEGEKE